MHQYKYFLLEAFYEVQNYIVTFIMEAIYIPMNVHKMVGFID